MKKNSLRVVLGTILSVIIVIGTFISLNINGQADTGRDVTVNNFTIGVYYDDADQAASIPDSEYTITYADADGKSVKVAEGETDSEGAIKNVTLPDIPTDVSTIKFNYTLGNSSRGYILRSTGKKCQFTYIKAIPNNNQINYVGNSKFGQAGNEASYQTNYISTRINNYYVQAIQELTSAIDMAHKQFTGISTFELAPINITYERGYHLNESNAFYRNGHDGSGTPDIVLADRTNLSSFTSRYLMANVMHEWTHWNLYRTAGLPSGSYTSHYSYNTDFKISYKEGLALFAGDMFAYDYDMNATDTEVQTDNANNINRLYGKSTNKTVEQVLYDLLDVKSTGEDEDFYITERYLDDDLTEKQIDKINFGVIYAEMMQSKVMTLSDYLQYIQNKYVLTNSDKAKFEKVLSVNGLSSTGEFTLDADGNALTSH
ncbi:hypothetical protein C5Z25_07750 [Lactobacillus sp. CBA3605]|uniref:hypothetical protein n=1 Tax=Lactobacillus sp. CBA3605 TaxID=2099788 RepID=UPI000CFB213F|nr:hypothetical protein [Lactobacillus sp. CBA3605]AVK61675.1 hypothetical protein C5Z25_07750 [Lactobacillus sp. CBA3605]